MKKGDIVEIDFVGRLESGEIFDLTKEDVAKKEKIFNPNYDYKPITVVIGEGFILPALENVLLSMDVGEKKKVVLKPKDAFGERDPNLVRTLPERIFENHKIAVGMIVDFGGIKARIQSISGGRVRLDFNHPLAGKKIIYEIEIKKLLKTDEEKTRGILEFFGFKNMKLEGDKLIISQKNVPEDLKKRIIYLVTNYTDIKEVRFEE